MDESSRNKGLLMKGIVFLQINKDIELFSLVKKTLED